MAKKDTNKRGCFCLEKLVHFASELAAEVASHLQKPIPTVSVQEETEDEISPEPELKTCTLEVANAMYNWVWDNEELVWLTNLSAEDISLVVSGSKDSPDPHLCASLLAQVANLKILAEKIADFLEHNSVLLERKGLSSPITHPERPFITFIQMEARDRENPHIIHAYVVTEYPDPYFLYDVTFNDLQVMEIVAGLW